MAVNYNCINADVYPKKTLLALRTQLMLRMGYDTAQAANSSSTASQLANSYLQEAQDLLFQRYSVFRLERWFQWSMTTGQRFYGLLSNDDTLQIPTPVNAAFSTSTSGGVLAAATHYYRVAAVNANGTTLASAETSITTSGATSSNTVNWTAPTVPSGVLPITGYNIYGRTTGAEQLIASVGLVLTYVDTGAVAPAGALPTVNTTQISSRTIDPRRVTFVGMSQNDNAWRSLSQGINPSRYRSSINSIPDCYEIRQSIEVWPAPSDNTWVLHLKGYFDLDAFAVDTDYTTIDHQAIALLALANAKAHEGQADAGNYKQMLDTYIGDVTAGTHGTRRYFPGRYDPTNAVPPLLVGPYSP